MQLASSGGRRLRHAALAAGRLALGSGPSVTRKDLSEACRMAEEALGLRPSVRLVLSELVANWGEQTWERLLVWPSNEHLVRRTGLSERAVRDAFRALVDLGVIVPKESPNGKRYALRDAEGKVMDAYGFDLTPLYARRETWAGMVAVRKAERTRIRRAFDEITIARRATQEALAALRDTFPDVSLTELETAHAALTARTPRRSATMPPETLIDEWRELRANAEDLFFLAGKDGEICRHNESNTESSGEACNNGAEPAECDPSYHQPTTGADPTDETTVLHDVLTTSTQHRRRVIHRRSQSAAPPTGEGRTPLSPEMLIAAVPEACPAVLQFGRPLRATKDLVDLGRHVRSLLGASETVWIEAEASIGATQAATSVLYVLQLYEDDLIEHGGESRIRNPGGYLRAFVRLVASGKIDLNSELLGMRRRRMKQ
ncbi:replication protein C [Acuticoccus sediminis]|uniref:Replication protein C n=2 Tax=Acuticoccus sediminis TaxID=2184697 RepID=A0A8B2NVE2_9HYPH|nr:replication protein C [Acuticoccus sediminis]